MLPTYMYGKMKNNPCYSYQTLYRLLNGEMDDLREIASIFVKEVPADINSLKHAISQKDYKIVQYFSHKLKSSLPNFLPENHKTMPRQLELMAARQEDWMVIQQAFETMEDVSLRAVEALKVDFEF